MLETPARPTVATHWGLYRARMDARGPVALDPFEGDADPSPLGLGSVLLQARTSPARIGRPAVRRSVLERGLQAGGEGRGREPFVEVDWDTALALVADAIGQVKGEVGNEGLYGGSYGWSSAGRFHHAQSQIHRFMNGIGGCTRSVQNYSHGAGETILPYVVGDRSGLVTGQTSWEDIAAESQLVVMFGGAPWRNAQVNSGGVSRHVLREAMLACRRAGVRFVSISPVRDDTLDEVEAEWLAPRPGSDVALMLGIAHTLLAQGLHDAAFLARHTTGFDRFAAYVRGESDGVAKSADWAAALCGLPAERIRSLAQEMARSRTMLMMSWSLQRAQYGEQPYWMAITLAAMLGQIGTRGGGFGFGYGSVNGIGRPLVPLAWPALAQGSNPVKQTIPVARLSDMLLHPGEPYEFEGQRLTYPGIRLVYWAGGNPFHHHQDINRLLRAWRKPQLVVVHESFWTATARHADVVLPTTVTMERNDIACSARDNLIAPSHRIVQPWGESRNDHDIFADLAQRLGVGPAFTEGRDEEAWLRHLYAQAAERARGAGFELPGFDAFWAGDPIVLPVARSGPPLLSAFVGGQPLKTPSGRIEIFSETIAGFDYDDCPGHPVWREPAEWLGAPLSRDFPLHLVSNAPSTKLHSQYDHGELSRAAKVRGREPLRMHPSDAQARGLADGDVVRVFNRRGALLAGLVVSDVLMPGVVQIATGAWYDPLDAAQDDTLDKHGNPNMVTLDIGTSRLSQATSALTCLVQVERFEGEPPPLGCYEPPAFVGRA
ncbi:molybdopterin-dependent oxidoreductase [Ramlibacter sp. AW1]|uniref:Molybdopterin-dependent oxidoreductase n=1 Tax=Ramlibacter aurantiacus TaxID=2801330 RepID=A0A936ZQL4_9BURK|nr:molybdopterin-dependent oxidoreductase [Ramlibacter aurantiacus]MBL0419205.1 molybdopterin-dependent oxidoreductase [Ramlibacter aurantiacus]